MRHRLLGFPPLVRWSIWPVNPYRPLQLVALSLSQETLAPLCILLFYIRIWSTSYAMSCHGKQADVIDFGPCKTWAKVGYVLWLRNQTPLLSWRTSVILSRNGPHNVHCRPNHHHPTPENHVHHCHRWSNWAATWECDSKGAMIQSNFWNGNLSFFIENFTFAIKSESSRVVSYILHLLYSECPVIWIYQNKVFYHMCLVYWEALTWMTLLSIIEKMMMITT